MAYGDPYATVQDLEARLGRLDDGRFAKLLDAASWAVEEFTGRQFNRDTGATPVATARRFRASDPQRLPTDDFHTTDGLAVEVNGRVWNLANVDPRPWNGVYKGMTGWPYSDLIAVGRSWPDGRQAKITVTAHWGWAAVPEGIRQATLDVAESSFGGGGSGIVKTLSVDAYSVSYAVPGPGEAAPPELVKAAPYRRVRFGVA